MSPQLPNPLFKLVPPEIRSRIFRYVFESPTGMIILRPPSFRDHSLPPTFRIATSAENPQFISLQILRTCHQMYSECRGLVWEYNELILHWPFSSSRIAPLPPISHTLWVGDNRITRIVQNVALTASPDKLRPILSRSRHWKCLKSISINLADPRGSSRHSELGHEGFMQLLASRQNMLTQGKRSDLYAGMLRDLSEAGGSNGYLSHLDKIIRINTGASTFNVSSPNNPYAERLIETKHHPDDMLLEMNKAFGGELWFDGMKCYQNGGMMKPATVSIGALVKGQWMLQTLYSRGRRGEWRWNDWNQELVVRQPILGERSGLQGFQYERDLAQLFIAMIAAEIAGDSVGTALAFVRHEEWKETLIFPPFPQFMDPEQVGQAVTFAMRAAESWCGEEIGPLERAVVERLYHRCLEGVNIALASGISGPVCKFDLKYSLQSS